LIILEQWVDIIGFENLYQVSNFGRVRSVTHTQYYTDKNGKQYARVRKGTILKPAPMTKKNGKGYMGVTLYKNGKHPTVTVHRLVAQHFIPNPDNLPQINHKDENPLNNHVDNLEWCTCSYNINYGTANLRRANTLSKRGVPV
jgi:hypothetical protein